MSQGLLLFWFIAYIHRKELVSFRHRLVKNFLNFPTKFMSPLNCTPKYFGVCEPEGNKLCLNQRRNQSKGCSRHPSQFIYGLEWWQEGWDWKWVNCNCILGADSRGFSNRIDVDNEGDVGKDNVWNPTRITRWTVSHPWNRKLNTEEEATWVKWDWVKIKSSVWVMFSMRYIHRKNWIYGQDLGIKDWLEIPI